MHRNLGASTPSETATVTPTPSNTPTISPVSLWGNGADGDLVVSSNFNINTQNSSVGRSCPDGGDAVTYSVVEVWESSARLSSTPSVGCFSVGDEVLLINMQGTSSNNQNVGNYEFFRISAVAGDTLVFIAPKANYYGDNGGDSNIGTAATNQHVMLMRVPNYNSVAVSGTLTASAWNGTRFGLIVFRVKNTLSGVGNIKADNLGYRGGRGGWLDSPRNQHSHAEQGESYPGLGISSTSNNGGGGGGETSIRGAGGGFGVAGANGSASPVTSGGAAYGDAALSQMWLGSGGGGGEHTCTPCSGGYGGSGGGGIYVFAKTISYSGTLTAKGQNGTNNVNSPYSSGGGGSGGAIRLEAESISLSGSVSAINGNGYISGNGGIGRIAFHSQGSLSYGSVSPAPYPQGTATPTPTVTFTPTATPTSTPTPLAGWQDNQYGYQGAHPHAVVSIDRGEVTDTFAYDANGNMTQRIEGGVTWTQTFNAENRLASVSNGADSWTFVYDGDGNRVKQVNPDGKLTLFLGGGVYTIEDAAGTPEVTKYYAVAGQRVALNGPDGLQYLLTDHLGSVDAVLDASGALLSQQRYMPFGRERQVGNGIEQTDFGYTGQRDLAAVGLMDYNARWYSQTVGVFTQPDMISNFLNPQSLNRYSYVANNPLNLTDPTGNSPCEDSMPDCSTGGPKNTSDPSYCEFHPNSAFCNPSPNEDQVCTGIKCDLEEGSDVKKIGPGYVGPLPQDIKDALIAQGANPRLLVRVTIHVETGGCWDPDHHDAETYGYDIYYCHPGVFDPEAPNAILVHELMHVSQWDNNLVATAANAAYILLKKLVNHNYDPYHDPKAWVEYDAQTCQDAYDANPDILLNSDPCPIQ